MACAIGLSRILREDRATKDGYEIKVKNDLVDGNKYDVLIKCHE